MILTIVIFLLILGVLIFVHELGHFLAARIFGVKTEEFGFGFPPRMAGIYFDEKKKKWKIVKGSKKIKSKNTIYSINWIPLGGFVKILGEDGENKEKAQKINKKEMKKSDDFSLKPIWQRIIILVCGVAMNFYFAGIILSLGFLIGTPEPVVKDNQNYRNPIIQILEVVPDSPAEKMGIKPGDEIVKISSDLKTVEIIETDQVYNFINQNKGEEIMVEVNRGNDVYRLKGTPRVDYEEGEGSLGIGFEKIAIVSYPLQEAVINGFSSTFAITGKMFSLFVTMFTDLFQGDTQKIESVSGPIGIVVYTNQFTEMGLAYVLRFAALLSINLAIINILPIPALDGGRILFLIIEKIKGKPVSSKIEGGLHALGMYLLLFLMLFITIRDISKFKNNFLVIWEKILNLFN